MGHPRQPFDRDRRPVAVNHESTSGEVPINHHTLQRHAEQIAVQRVQCICFIGGMLGLVASAVAPSLSISEVPKVLILFVAPILAIFYMVAVAPHALPNHACFHVSACMMATSGGLAHTARMRYYQWLHVSALEHALRFGLAVCPVLLTWAIALNVWRTEGKAFWPTLRFAFGFQCASCSLLVLLLHHYFVVPDDSYPPGLPFSHSLCLNLFVVGVACGLTQHVREFVSQALGSSTLHLSDLAHSPASSVPATSDENPDTVSEVASRNGDADVMILGERAARNSRASSLTEASMEASSVASLARTDLDLKVSHSGAGCHHAKKIAYFETDTPDEEADRDAQWDAWWEARFEELVEERWNERWEKRWLDRWEDRCEERREQDITGHAEGVQGSF